MYYIYIYNYKEVLQCIIYIIINRCCMYYIYIYIYIIIKRYCNVLYIYNYKEVL